MSQILEKSTIACALVYQSGEIVFQNAHFSELFDLATQQQIGNLNKLLKSNDLNKVMNLFEKIFQHNSHETCDINLRKYHSRSNKFVKKSRAPTKSYP